MDAIMIVAFAVAALLTFGGLHLDKRSADKAARKTDQARAVPPDFR